jgi:hypothetical protein
MRERKYGIVLPVMQETNGQMYVESELVFMSILTLKVAPQWAYEHVFTLKKLISSRHI